MAVNSQKGYKTLWKKEKWLIMSHFSFSHSVFKRLVLQTHKKQGLFRKGLRHNPKFNLPSDDKIAALSRLKAFADNNFIVAQA